MEITSGIQSSANLATSGYVNQSSAEARVASAVNSALQNGSLTSSTLASKSPESELDLVSEVSRALANVLNVFAKLLTSLAKLGSVGQSASSSENGTSANSGSGKVSASNMLWKPVSTKGTLAILMPKSVTGSVRQVQLVDKNGHIVETGKEVVQGAAESGRINYRFKRSGGSYPPGVTVRITFNNGSQQEIVENKPGERHGK